MVLSVMAGQRDRWQPTELVSMLLSPGARQVVNSWLKTAVVLNELLRKGIVESLESGHVLLKRSTYAPLVEKGTDHIGDYDTDSDFDNRRRRHSDP